MDGLVPDDVAARLGEIAAEAGALLSGAADRADGHCLKADGSPATAADLASERVILARLAEAWPAIPVVSEEKGTAPDPPGETFFLVDPLDGTRDFVAGSGEYSVNIALVRAARPVAAALAAPGLRRIWIAGTTALEAEIGSAAAWRAIRTRSPGDRPVALVSRRHGDPASEEVLAGLAAGERRTASSAIKFGFIAAGEADVYVRGGPTMEWDTAAGDHILCCAGGAVVGPDGAPLAYGAWTRGFLNGPFAALGDPALAAAPALAALSPGRGAP